ncbi:MAG TPA: hypothetical protein VIH57_26410, partial [Bacteroidales bacterium]
MNYIKHLTGFFNKVVPDHRLNPTHISLYLSLFQYWNVNRFHNPISISRSEMMQVSKICSKATYHKCMRDLHNFGYIKYCPSYNPFKGSLVYLIIFDPDFKPGLNTDMQSTKIQTSDGTGTGTGTEQALAPSVNYKNMVNNKTYMDEKLQAQSPEKENPSHPED